jgi:hypothetical protein
VFASTLKIEEEFSSKMLVFTHKTTLRHNPESFTRWIIMAVETINLEHKALSFKKTSEVTCNIETYDVNFVYSAVVYTSLRRHWVTWTASSKWSLR